LCAVWFFDLAMATDLMERQGWGVAR